MKFTVHATAAGSRARAATLETAHSTVETPVFMPVGTRGTVRTQTLAQLTQLDAPILLANTYHLMLRPGIEVFERFGGLHRFMGWPRSILTDSGGFQIFSLPGTTIDEAGATLRSPGARPEVLTPERSIAMQRAIGADIMMVLDQCIASTSSHAHATAAMQLTHRWAARSLAARGDSPNALFAIVQGACFDDLRTTSAAALTELAAGAPRPFDGYAVGGLAVGETRAQREDTTELVTAHLPLDRPRYLMGVGMPIDLLEAVHRGIDMFDCILPTALAQQGVAFTSRGRVDLRRGVYRLADAALDPACACEACTRPRAYLHHLFRCKEPLGWQLVAFHNLSFYTRLMADIRGHIRAGTFAAFHAAQREILDRVDLDNPPGPSPRVKSTRPATRGAFAVHTSPRGFTSIQHLASGEIMHSVNEPDVEAARIYVAQSALLAAALAPGAPTSSAPAAPSVSAVPDATAALHVPDAPRALHGSDAPRALHGSDAPRALHVSDAPRALHVSDAPRALHVSDAPRALHVSDAPRALPPLVVWDVGLGAGHNAMALIRAIEAADAAVTVARSAVTELARARSSVTELTGARAIVTKLAGVRATAAELAGARATVTDPAPGILGAAASHRPIEIISFEHDLDAFRLALAHGAEFPHLRHRAPHILAHRGHVREPRFTWTLREADFLTAFATQPRPDVIFYDPFSSKVDTAMWSLDAFTRLFAYLTAPAAPAAPSDRAGTGEPDDPGEPRDPDATIDPSHRIGANRRAPSTATRAGDHRHPVELFTYTNSTAIRSALLAAGFHVARGVGSGPKTETTIALTQPLAPHALLGRDWLARRDRSTAKFPADVPPAEHAAFDQAIRSRPQFA